MKISQVNLQPKFELNIKYLFMYYWASHHVLINSESQMATVALGFNSLKTPLLYSSSYYF